MRQFGIFGGTFDPVHWGHLLVAETALHQVPLEQIIWVPSYNPPHKQATLFEHRIEMLLQAIAGNNAFVVSSIERSRGGTSYAINTLLDLSAICPNTHWYWIVGLDTFKTLPYWYRRHELALMCDWLIAPRLLTGQNIEECELVCQKVEQQLKSQSIPIQWYLLHTPLVGVSSSLIRNFSGEGKSIRYLVPEAVRTYITNHNLYSNTQ
jgi:nicotinate-nucleotide adenylyltransferase